MYPLYYQAAAAGSAAQQGRQAVVVVAAAAVAGCALLSQPADAFCCRLVADTDCLLPSCRYLGVVVGRRERCFCFERLARRRHTHLILCSMRAASSAASATFSSDRTAAGNNTKR